MGSELHHGLSEEELEELDGGRVDRRGLLLRGGVAAAGLTMLGSPAAAFAARAGSTAKTTKLAVVTHGDTGSFWSVFKAGVDQATRDLKGRGVKVTQVYANNDVAKQVAGINTAIAAKVDVIATSVPDASALKGPLSNAAKKGIEIITVNSGEDAFDNVPAIQKTFETHVGQDEEVAGEGAGRQFNAAGAKSVVVVIHEASNSGLTERAAGVKKTFHGKTSTLLIPNAKSDIPGTVAKVKAYFARNHGTDALLGLDPDVTVPCIAAAPHGTKIGTFDLNGDVIKNLESGKMLFAIDQQQYLQGYLPVVFSVLFVNNLNTVGGGKPILTGPGIVNRANAARVAALAKAGTR
ncbi:MAG TPA: substrate-binding domain-containing protein [Gaiellaceae bacterium]|jgi:simple sugar transport system substrate-binding protein